MKKISDAELQVMKVIWNKKETTSFEIINELKNCNWSHNTIRTLINRLVIKKAIGISKKDGKQYSYVPLVSENEYKMKASKEFVEMYFHNSISELLDFLNKNTSMF